MKTRREVSIALIWLVFIAAAALVIMSHVYFYRESTKCQRSGGVYVSEPGTGYRCVWYRVPDLELR